MESFSLKSFNKASPPTDSEKKLQEEVAALQSQLKKAEKEVADLTDRLNREPAEQRRQGLEEGVRQGRQTTEENLGRGYEKSLEQLRGELTAVVQELDQQVPRLFLDFERTSATLALECVRKVFDESARHLEEGIGAIVRKAVEAAGKTKTLLIKVHPDDLKSVKDSQYLWEPINGKLDSLKIEPDSRLTRGSCAVESSSSTVEMAAEKIYKNMCREVELLFSQKAKALDKADRRISGEGALSNEKPVAEESPESGDKTTPQNDSSPPILESDTSAKNPLLQNSGLLQETETPAPPSAENLSESGLLQEPADSESATPREDAS